MPGSLSWSLVIATYNRQDVLLRCLALAAQQTRPPLEIIVVDASPDWTAARERVMAELAVHRPHIHWHYVEARHRSSAGQRNQGVRLATADVVFLIDDDSLMYSDCAEHILPIYEADTQGQVAAIMADEATTPPDAASGA